MCVTGVLKMAPGSAESPLSQVPVPKIMSACSARGKPCTTHASITARPFFLHRGYRVVKKQTVRRQGIPLTNYIMEKPAALDVRCSE